MKLSLGKDSGKGISISAGGRVSVGGDVVQGDKTVNVTNFSTSSEELSKLFADIYKKIEARPADLNVDKEEVKQDVRRIEEEVKKGDEANSSKVERWLKGLADMAPDIFEVTAAALTNPAAAVSTVIRKVVAKAKEASA